MTRKKGKSSRALLNPEDYLTYLNARTSARRSLGMIRWYHLKKMEWLFERAKKLRQVIALPTEDQVLISVSISGLGH